MLASAEVAETRRDRRRGLLGRTSLDGALVLRDCRWIHTLGMHFPLDVAYVGTDGVVLKTVRMSCHRVGMPVRGAAMTVEAEAGAFVRWGLQAGNVVELRPTEPGAGPPDQSSPR